MKIIPRKPDGVAAVDLEVLFANKPGVHVLNVVGDGFANVHILAGDQLVVQQQHQAHRGDMVVFATDGGDVDIAPFAVSSGRTLGVVLGLIRRFHTGKGTR